MIKQTLGSLMAAILFAIGASEPSAATAAINPRSFGLRTKAGNKQRLYFARWKPYSGDCFARREKTRLGHVEGR